MGWRTPESRQASASHKPHDVPVMTGEVEAALRGLGVRATAVAVLKDEPFANSSWLVESAERGRIVLRRYHDRATTADITYEHAVLRHVASKGWVVPAPIGDPLELQGRIYSLNRFVPGGPAHATDREAQDRRGRDLARLHIDLRGLAERLGQRPGWRAQHHNTTVHIDIDWNRCLAAFTDIDDRLAEWAALAAADAQATLADLNAHELPELVVQELHTLRWPLDELEEACMQPIYSAFRVDMVAWLLDHGHRTGDYDLEAIGRHLARTATPAP
ncbi:MAG TPA: phosphotransferase [Acidimicrobiales bacterium]|nr:phosphotransferase [Acidimicrobiales bacterium]